MALNAHFQINQASNTIPSGTTDLARIDVRYGQPVHFLGDSSSGQSNPAWVVLAFADGSARTQPTNANTFDASWTPDVPGSYLVDFQVNDGLGAINASGTNHRQFVVRCTRDANGLIVDDAIAEPAFGELVGHDNVGGNDRGYAKAFEVGMAAQLPAIANVMNLRARRAAKHKQVQLLGYYAPGDGGGDIFAWDSSSTAADNGGTIFQPGYGTGAAMATGRWVRIYAGPLFVPWFGIKGDGVLGTNAAKLTALCAWAATNLISTKIIFPSVGNAAQQLHYVFESTVTVPGGFGQSFVFEGEYCSPVGIGGARLTFAGPAGNAFFDLKGCNAILFENFDVQCGALAKYGFHFRPDEDTLIGASKLTMRNVNIRSPQDADGAACIGAGPETGDSLNQADNIVLEHCRLIGNAVANPSYRAVGFRNISGGNAKLFTFNHVNIGAFKHAYEFLQTSGPITITGGGVSECRSSAFNASSAQVFVEGWDFETNYGDCYLIVGSFGGGNGSFVFKSCEIEHQDGPGTGHGTATTDRMIAWPGGMVGFEGCTIWNHREIAVTSASNANPIVVGVPTTAGMFVGKRIQIRGVRGNTNTNTAAGAFTTVTAVGGSTITIDAVGNGAYSGGGTIAFEPEILLSTQVVGVGTPKSGLYSIGNDWFNCASNLPVYNYNTLARFLDSANAQANPFSGHSFGDMGVQFQELSPGSVTEALYPLKMTWGTSPRWASLGLGYLRTDANGNMSSGSLNVVADVTTTTTLAATVTLVRANINSNSQVITLPPPALVMGNIQIVDSGAHATAHPFLMTGGGSITINGSTTGVNMTTDRGAIVLASDGTNYHIVGGFGWEMA